MRRFANRRATKGRAGGPAALLQALTSRSPTERNAADTPDPPAQ